jgi:hypothetical protein
MLNRTKTYYCVQHKFDGKQQENYILYPSRLKARLEKQRLGDKDFAIVKVKVVVHWK